MATKKTGPRASAKRRKRAKAKTGADQGAPGKVPRPRADGEPSHSLFDLFPDPLFLIDNATGRILEANAAAAALYGYTHEELLALPNTALSAEPESTRRVTTETPVAPEVAVQVPARIHRKKDGTVFPVEITGRFFFRDGRAVHLAAIRDVTERARAEEALAQERFLLGALMRNIPDQIYFKDRSSRFIMISEALARAFGVGDPAHAVGKTDFDFFTEEHARQAFEDEQAIIRTGQPTTKEERETWADRPDTWVWSTKAPLRDQDGNLVGTLGISRDITERKLAEEARRNSLALVEATLESTANGILVVGPDGAVVRANARFAEMWRIPGEVLASGEDQRLLDHVLGQLTDPDAFIARVQAVYHDPRAESADLLHFKDGRVFERTSRPMLVEGEPKARVWSFLDITERTRAEAALRESEARFRTLYENTTIGLYRTTPGGEINLANPALVRMLGYSSFEELQSRNLERSGFEPSYGRAQFVARLERDGEVSGLESAWQRDDGTTFFARESARAIRDARGVTLYYDGTVEDITERKQAESALRESEARLRDVVSSVVGWVWEVDGNGVYTYSSRQGSDILGRPAADIIGKTPFDFMPPEEAARVAVIFTEIVANKAPIKDLENWNIGKDGKRLCLLTNGVPILDDDGRLRGYRGVDSDITERKRVEAERAELEARNRQLQKAESLGRMAGAIAHHFNNQLSSVLVSLELAKEELPQDSAPAKDVTEAMLAATRAAEMSTLMLTYLGQTAAVREPLDLSVACGGWLSLLREGLPKHVVLEADLASPGPRIRADAEQIRQVFAHLVANAWEAGGAGRSVVRVAVKAVAAAAIPPAHRVPPDWHPQEPVFACLEVVDRGCGVAEADIEKLFDPFFSSKFTGRGLGLAVVLGIVRAHGGGVTVESTPGRGSAFRVYVPMTEAGVR